MTDIPDATPPATVERLMALVDHDGDGGDERFDDLLLVLAGDEADVTTEQGTVIAAIIATFTAEQITDLRRAYDLCPVHRGDIQICVDDDEPDRRPFRHRPRCRAR